MLDTTERQALIKELKKNNKNSVFGALFYTLLFVLCLFAAIALKEESLASRLAPTILVGIIAGLQWAFYISGRKNVKETNLMIEQMERHPESDAYDKYYTTDEERELLKAKFKPLTRSMVLASISLLLFAGLIAAIELVPLLHWGYKLLAGMLALIAVIYVLRLFVFGKAFYRFVDVLGESSDSDKNDD